ncbi:MAG: hypothetical protein IJN42_00115 [Clostridia bacterium]|nr:hypothetical protein [Clostridia bacterium]
MDNKTLFALMCIFFNAYGVPCFMQGRKDVGIKRIVFGIITCGVLATINSIMGIILGIKVFQMSDEEFEAQKDTLTSGIPA